MIGQSKDCFPCRHNLGGECEKGVTGYPDAGRFCPDYEREPGADDYIGEDDD